MSVSTTQSAPAVDTSSYPSWLQEPAKLVGWLVAAVLVICAGITELISAFSDLIPAKYQATVQVVVGVVAAVTVIATRVQALLTRARVYAPATIDAVAATRHAGQTIGTPPVTGV